MNCSASIPQIGTENCSIPSIETRMKNFSFQLKGHSRKALKLLAKQYNVDSVVLKNDDDSFFRETEKDYLEIIYFARENPNEKFIWKIHQQEIIYI